MRSIEKIANDINRDYELKNPLFIAVLNGAFMFAADLLKHIQIECDISFVKYSSYSGTTSTGNVTELIGLDVSPYQRHVIILEDIVDSGATIDLLRRSIYTRQPIDVKIATLFFKKVSYTMNIPISYSGIEVPNKFIIGYGLDIDGKGRNLRDVYQLED